MLTSLKSFSLRSGQRKHPHGLDTHDLNYLSNHWGGQTALHNQLVL